MPGRTNHAGRPLAADRRPGAAHGPVILPWLAAYAFGHGVDVTGEPLERGIASLEAHAQYLAGIPGHPPPRLMITGITRMLGRAMGVPHAVLFRAWDFHAPPPIAAEALAAAQEA